MEALGEDDPMMSPYLNNLGRFYKDTARYTEAELLLRKSLCYRGELTTPAQPT
jgi:hypothetical protein